MNEFPLQPFLHVWAERELSRRECVAVTPRDYQRISALLRSGGDWTLARLCDALMSLLARSPQQQDDFLRCFNDFFSQEGNRYEGRKIDLDRALADLRSFAERQGLSEPGKIEQVVVSEPEPPPVAVGGKGTLRMLTRNLLLLLAVAAAGCLALGVWVGWTMIQTAELPPMPPLELLPHTPRIPDARPTAQEIQAVGRSLQTLPSDINYLDALVVSPLLWLPVYFFYRAYRRKRRKRSLALAVKAPHWDSSKPLHFRAGRIGDQPAPLMSQDQLNEIASALGYSQETAGARRFDVRASASATSRRRTLTLFFRPGRRLWRLYILEDKLAEASRWHTAARELAKAMAARGLAVESLYFRGVPTKFQTAEGEDVEWHELEDERDGHALLFFSDSQALDLADEQLLSRLLDWPMCAWMELREPREWDAGTARVARVGVPVYPATATGIARALKSFHDRRPDARKLSVQPGNFRQIRSPVTAADVEYWLGDAFRWAQACAMLQPVTHGLADALRRRFQPHVPPECWGRLLLLPDTYVGADGVKFSDEVLAVLRQAFSIRWDEAQQEEILLFIIEQVSKAEPREADSLEHLTWEWTLERVRLELSPDEALPRLQALERTPLSCAIRADLENVVLPGTELKLVDAGGRPLLPLRRRPEKKESLRQLASIAELIHASEVEVRPARLTFHQLWRRGIYRKWLEIHNSGSEATCQIKVEASWLSCEPEQLTVGKPAAALSRTRRDAEQSRRVSALRSKFRDLAGAWRTWLMPQRVAVRVNTRELMPGESRSQVTVTARGEVFVIPVSVYVRRSRREAAARWQAAATAYAVREFMPAAVLTVGCALLLTYAALPSNWVNRLHNRPPQLKSLSARARGRNGSAAQPLVARAEAIEVRASADDPEGGALRYEWQLEEQTLNTHGALVSLKPKQDIFQVTLKLYDSDGGMAVFRDMFTVVSQPSGAALPPGPSINTAAPGRSTLAPGETRAVTLPNGVWLNLAYIPPGQFNRGSLNTEEDHYTDEEPQHMVTIDYGFFMSETEVTQEQWEAVMEDNPSYFQNCPTCPVERVSQNDAKEFIKRLNLMQTGYVFRLPTESEWEYAARAGTTTVFAFGNALTSKQANFDGNYPYGSAPKGENIAKTTPVNTYLPNAWGLYDMHGNVAEWCEDIYQDSYVNLPTDGSANIKLGDPNSRVLRGGSWLNYGGSLRSADRNWVPIPSSQNFNVGVRLVAMPATESL